MTPSDAIALAREAGIHHLFDEIYEAEADALLAFANLVEERVKGKAADMLDAAIARGYATPPIKQDQCEHGKFGWEDCIACYDVALDQIASAIRAME